MRVCAQDRTRDHHHGEATHQTATGAYLCPGCAFLAGGLAEAAGLPEDTVREIPKS